MRIRPVDPRDMTWEQDHAVYRVYFWDTASTHSHEYQVSEADIDEVLAWTRREAESHGWSYTVYAQVGDDGQPGLVRLCGVMGDPFAA
ncbi:hypothetical protein AB0L75_38345 [Streptomyces sp. NPDC052101]|uniref:hypothetical protein n=1 Tax=Streptomyces sp. NPDC052101 TaxID=3155763 RepID=UPI003421011B